MPKRINKGHKTQSKTFLPAAPVFVDTNSSPISEPVLIEDVLLSGAPHSLQKVAFFQILRSTFSTEHIYYLSFLYYSLSLFDFRSAMVAECVASSDGIMALRTQSSRLVRGYILNLCRRRNFRAAGVTERCVKRNISTAIGAFRHPFYLLDVFLCTPIFQRSASLFFVCVQFPRPADQFYDAHSMLARSQCKAGQSAFPFRK